MMVVANNISFGLSEVRTTSSYFCNNCIFMEYYFLKLLCYSISLIVWTTWSGDLRQPLIIPRINNSWWQQVLFQDFGLLSASFCLSFSHDAPHHSFIQNRNLLKTSLELFEKQFLEVAFSLRFVQGWYVSCSALWRQMWLVFSKMWLLWGKVILHVKITIASIDIL